MVIDPMLGWSLRLLAKLRVGVAEVCVVIYGINHLKGEVVRGSGNGDGGEGSCIDQSATGDVDEELVVG